MTEPVQQVLIRGTLHRPASQPSVVVILAHGAGSDSNSKLMVALASAFAEAGFAALRIDLPFRQERRGGAPNPKVAERDREGLREAAQWARQFGTVVLGGHSYGGRQASMLAAEQPDVASKLLLLSYPLHPPAKPAQLRTAHFPNLNTPAVFIHGSKDPFGSPAEMEEALKLIPSNPALHIVQGAAHELKPVITQPSLVIGWLGMSAT
jgi:hypothetical protein